MDFLVGYVLRVVKSPLKQGALTLFGEWADFVMSRGKVTFVRQFRNETPIGTWGVHAITSFSSSENGTRWGVTVVPQGSSRGIEVGDIFASTECDVEFYPIEPIDVGMTIGTFKGYEDKCHCVLYRGLNSQMIALVKNKGAELPATLYTLRQTSGPELAIRIKHRKVEVSSRAPLQVKIGASKIPLKTFINTVNPIRSFVLDAGEELFSGSSTRRIPRRQNIYEPDMFLEVGSIRILLAPAELGQMNLFVAQTVPLTVFFRTMYIAENLEPLVLNRYLSSQFYDVGKYLRHLRDFTRAYSRVETIQLSVGGDEPLYLTGKSQSTVDSALKMLSKRIIQVAGELYAIDTKRNWFKVYDDSTGVDWKFITKKSFMPFTSLKSVGTTNIFVQGETDTPEHAPKGIADFISFLDP